MLQSFLELVTIEASSLVPKQASQAGLDNLPSVSASQQNIVPASTPRPAEISETVFCTDYKKLNDMNPYEYSNLESSDGTKMDSATALAYGDSQKKIVQLSSFYSSAFIDAASFTTVPRYSLTGTFSANELFFQINPDHNPHDNGFSIIQIGTKLEDPESVLTYTIKIEDLANAKKPVLIGRYEGRTETEILLPNYASNIHLSWENGNPVTAFSLRRYKSFSTPEQYNAVLDDLQLHSIDLTGKAKLLDNNTCQPQPSPAISTPTPVPASAPSPNILRQENAALVFVSRNGTDSSTTAAQKAEITRNLGSTSERSALDYWKDQTEGELNSWKMISTTLQITPECDPLTLRRTLLAQTKSQLEAFQPTVYIGIIDNNLGCTFTGFNISEPDRLTRRPGVIFFNQRYFPVPDILSLTHELGHALGGLGHASNLSCPSDIDSYYSCRKQEYTVDDGVMGNLLFGFDRFVGINKIQLLQALNVFDNWSPNHAIYQPRILTVDRPGTYTISCESLKKDGKGISLLEIPRESQDDDFGESFWVSCRSNQPGSRYEDHLAGNQQQAVSVYLASRQRPTTLDDHGFNYYRDTVLVPSKEGQLFAGRKDSFNLLGSSLSYLRVVDQSSNSATVQITKKQPASYRLYLPVVQD